MSSVFELPTLTDGTAHYEFQVPLNERLYRMEFIFNTRDDFWYLNLYDALSGDALRYGLKVVSEWDLLRLYSGPRDPGSLVPVPQGAAGTEANTLEALGTDVLLTYVGES